MGSKLLIKGDAKGSAVKCPHCTRTVATVAALKSHVLWNHSKGRVKLTSKAKQTVKVKKPAAVNNGSVVTVLSKLAKAGVCLSKGDKKNKSVAGRSNASTDNQDKFKCPDCDDSFTTILGMKSHRRIHSKRAESIKRSTSTPEEMPTVQKPACGCPLLSDMNFNMEEFITVVCGACRNNFSTFRDVMKHINLVHREGLISIFFPGANELFKWKAEMEKQTNCNFYTHKDINKDPKVMYVCARHIHTDVPKCYVQCPAMIYTQHFEKGIQVFYHKIHYGHSYTEYKLTPTVEKYLIKVMNRNAAKKAVVPEQDEYKKKIELHNEFTGVMTNIISFSAALNSKDMEYLIKKAKEMKDVIGKLLKKDSTAKSAKLVETLNSDNNSATRDMLELDSTESSDKNSSKLKGDKPGPKSAKRKRKSILKADDEGTRSPKIINTFTLVDFKDVEVKSEAESPERDLDAIVKETDGKHDNDLEGTPKIAKGKSDELVGNKSTVSLQDSGNSDVEIITKSPSKVRFEDPLATVSSQNGDSIDYENIIKSPKVKFDDIVKISSFNDSYKTFVEKATGQKVKEKEDKTTLSPKNPALFYNKNKSESKTISNNEDNILGDSNHKELSEKKNKIKKPNIKKKTKFQTKLGQFSPKKIVPSSVSKDESKESPKLSFGGSIKVHSYEVQERENDCNILILKI